MIGHTIKIELVDKLAALRLLGQHYGLFADKMEHSADDDLLQAIREGRARSLASP